MDRHEIERLRRSLVMAQDSPVPLPAAEVERILAALASTDEELRRLRAALRDLLDEGGGA